MLDPSAGFAKFPILQAVWVYFRRIFYRFLSSNLPTWGRCAAAIIHFGLFFSFAAVLSLLLRNLYRGASLASLLIPTAGVAIGFGASTRHLYRLTLSFSIEKKDGDVAALYFLITGIAAVGTFAHQRHSREFSFCDRYDHNLCEPGLFGSFLVGRDS